MLRLLLQEIHRGNLLKTEENSVEIIFLWFYEILNITLKLLPRAVGFLHWHDYSYFYILVSAKNIKQHKKLYFTGFFFVSFTLHKYEATF